MSRKKVTVTLSTPLVGHNGPITEVAFYEPTLNDYLDFGDPFTVAQDPTTGAPLFIPNNEAIRAYFSRCLAEGYDPLILERMPLSDGRKVREALLGFFQPGASGSEESQTSRTS